MHLKHLKRKRLAYLLLAILRYVPVQSISHILITYFQFSDIFHMYEEMKQLYCVTLDGIDSDHSLYLSFKFILLLGSSGNCMRSGLMAKDTI